MMQIEYSLKANPRDLITIQDVVSYTHTEEHCIILGSRGVLAILNENEIEDFTIRCEYQ